MLFHDSIMVQLKMEALWTSLDSDRKASVLSPVLSLFGKYEKDRHKALTFKECQAVVKKHIDKVRE